MSLIPNQLDNLKTEGVQIGALKFLSNVAQQLQLMNGNTSAGWATTMQQLNDIVLADNLRVLSAQGAETTRYISADLVAKKDGQFIDLATAESVSVSVPSSINTANGIITKTYNVIISEKTPYASNISSTANSSAINSFISTTLDTNSTYSNSNVSSSLQYAIAAGHTDTWTSLNSGSFDLTAKSTDMQTLTELGGAVTKSVFLAANFIR